MEKEYKDYFKFSFRVAYKELKHKEIAEDIASQTIYYFILNKKKNNIRKEYSWIYSTTKNYIKQYKMKKKENKKLNNEIYIKEIIDNSSDDNVINYVKENYAKIENYLTEKEKKLLNIYLKCNLKVNETANFLKEKNKNIERKITFLRTKIKALINQKLGYTVTKEIVPPNINRAMLIFLKNIKKAFENNSYRNLKRYLTNEQIDYIIKNVKIKKIKNYEVNLLDGIYKFSLFYEDFFNKIEIFSFKLKLTNKKISIFDLEKSSKKVFSLSINSENGQALLKLLKNAKRNKDGTLNIPDAIIEKLIEDYQKEGN